jgi:hypothetical protein
MKCLVLQEVYYKRVVKVNGGYSLTVISFDKLVIDCGSEKAAIGWTNLNGVTEITHKEYEMLLYVAHA